MVAEVRNFQVLVPAGTAQESPLVTDLDMPARVVRGVRVRIPPGPAGLVGWALGSAGERVLPWGADQWIVGDDEAIDWPLSQQIDSGAWQLQAYNLGAFDHTLYVTFLLDLPGSSSTLPSTSPLLVTPS
jgi:hypothetical protein